MSIGTEKSKGGRPSLYCPELVEKARDYLKNYAKLGRQIPSHQSLARHLNISRETLYAWKKEEGKEEFSDILEQILSEQFQVLIDKGLSGDFNATIVKLVLGKHGYHDKQDLNSSGGVTVVFGSSEASLL